MIKEAIAAGKDILEAKENARVALGAGELDDVQFEILDGGTKGILGLFTRPAKVRAYVELPDTQEKPHRERKKDNRRDQKKNDANNNNNQKNKKQNKPAEKKHENVEKASRKTKVLKRLQRLRATLFPRLSLRWNAAT